MSEFYRPPENAEHSSSQNQPTETTPAEVFGREAETVPVSRTTDQTTTEPHHGPGGQRPTTDVRHFKVDHPLQAIELDQDTQIIATGYNPRRDAWEVVTSTPR